MESLLFHPKLVHVPIALAVLMPLVAGGLWLAWWRKWLPARAFVVAAALQAVMVGAAVLSLRSGEADEDRVERFVSGALIEAHEAAAQAFTVGALVALVLMILALVFAARPAGLAIAALAALSTLAVFALGYRTGQAGGDLVYRHGAAQAFVTVAAPASGASPSAAPASAGTGRRHQDDD
jgi:uncharacterized membrane protein